MPGLLIIASCGLAVGTLGAWLLFDPWMPEPGSGIRVPPSNAVDLLGFGSAALAALSLLLHRKEHALFWRETTEGRPSPERPQSLRERLHNGFFMGLIAGTLAGTLADVGLALFAGVWGFPPEHRMFLLIPAGTAVSIAVQTYFVDAGLRGRITRGRSFTGLGR